MSELEKPSVIQRLRAARLRPTVARIGVLQVLETLAPGRFDVDTVFRDLIGRGVRVSHGTVYRTLKDLEAHGLALHEWRNGLSGGKAAYGIRPQGTQTGDARIVCGQCGCATAISDPGLCEQLRQLALRQGLNLAAQPMAILAVCAHCAGSGRNRSYRKGEASLSSLVAMPPAATAAGGIAADAATLR